MTYIQPVGDEPLQGQDLSRFLQQWIAGVLGAALDQTLIRPYTQSESPVVPNKGIAWCALGYSTEDSDTFPYVAALPNPQVGSTLQRHESIRIMCSFYDNGINGQAGRLASLLRDGLAISDNLEALGLLGYALVGCERQVKVPSLLSETWLVRVDQPLVIRRQITRTFEVPSIESAEVVLKNDVGLPDVDINVVENP